MCLIITTVAAIVTTIIWLTSKKAKNANISLLAFMYIGAALMWIVDSIYSVSEGEPFFNISLDDTYLGILVVVCGLAGYFVTRLVSRLGAKHE